MAIDNVRDRKDPTAEQRKKEGARSAGAGPFICKFKSFMGLPYIYDVNTNEMVQVDKVVYDILDDITLNNDDIVNKWRRWHDEDSVRKSIGEIREALDQGYFLSIPKVSMSPPACEGCLEDLMEGESCKLILNLTEDCNLRCVYCAFTGSYAHNRVHSDRVMDIGLGERAISRAFELAQKSSKASISFYGGEPFLYFDRIVHLIDHAKRIGTGIEELEFHIDTNGTILDREMREYLIRNKIYIQISLDGPKEVHDRYRVFRGGTGTFDTIMRNLEMLRSENEEYYQYHVGFASTVTPPYRLPDVDGFFERGEFESNVVMVTFVDPYDTTFFDSHCTEQEKSNLGEQIESLRRHYMRERTRGETPSKLARGLFDSSMIRLHKRGRTPLGNVFPSNGICIPGIRRFFVDTDGGIYPCERVGTAFKLGTVHGGVERGRVFGLIDEYIERSWNDCASCWAMRLCGICFAGFRKQQGFDIERKRENCTYELDRLRQALRTYVTILDENEHSLDFVEDLKIT
ncbi:MAG TPA: radical SAM protein [Patescibacteria group bacterium]|nr:radical SAM protein [Patescibacteria group bacterium]